MPDPQPTPLDTLERQTLYLLTDGEQPVWSVPDLGLALDNPIGAVDAVDGLRRAGLIQQTSDGFVFATHAAVRAVGMIGQVI